MVVPKNERLVAFHYQQVQPTSGIGQLPLVVRSEIDYSPVPGGGGTPSCDLNWDVRPDRVWFSGRFVLNRASISSLSVLNRVSLLT